MLGDGSKKIFLSLVLASVLALNFAWVKPAQAIFGVADVSVTTIIADIPQQLFNISKKIAEQFFKIYKKRLITMMQNDLVNWVQGGGKPRFVTDPKKFFADAADSAAVQALDDYFKSKNVDICSPFKANVQLMVERAVFLPEERSRCTLGQIKNNLVAFKDNFTQGGGWKTWIALHETNNTVPGAYLAAIETINANVGRAGNAATAQITAGKGFLDQKNCLKYTIRVSADELLEGGDLSALSEAQNEEFAKSGNVSETVDVTAPPYNKPDGIPPSEVPQNATCIETKTITPGGVIGDQISGALKATGIDKLINANDIASILDAVIDAAVNRAAREGLALMKSGRGSYTKPKAGTYKDRAKIQTDTLGLEGVAAAELLNTAIGLKNKVDSLEGTLNKFTANESRLEPFRSWLTQIPLQASNFTCSEKKAPGAAAKIERCFYNWNNNGNFNEENNNPGPYLANKTLLEELANLWIKIKNEAFAPKNNLSCSSAPFASYTLHPDEVDLPIIGGDGSGFAWEKADPYYKALELSKKPLSPGSLYAALAEAESNVGSYRSSAEAYNTLKDQNEQLKTQIAADKEFINSNLPALTLYTTVLMDYDTAGREITVGGVATNLVSVVKEYTEALSGRNDAAVEAAKSKLTLARRAAENKWIQTQRDKVFALEGEINEQERLQAETKLGVIERAVALMASPPILRARLILFDDKTSTITKPFADLSDVSPGQLIEVRPSETIPIDGTIQRVLDPDGKISKSGDYRPGQTVTAREVNRTNLTLEIKITSIINEGDQLGISPAEAVAQALLDVKDRQTGAPLAKASIEGLTNELELRESKVSKQQADTANKLGKFLNTPEERVQAGLDGGDSEWEKYFYNRTQYGYASIIYDYYKNRFKCE